MDAGFLSRGLIAGRPKRYKLGDFRFGALADALQRLRGVGLALSIFLQWVAMQ